MQMHMWNLETGPEFIMIPICDPIVLEINVFILNFLGHMGMGGFAFVFCISGTFFQKVTMF